jgi:peptidyl-prolyl cis-trans isomerase D
MMTFLRKHRNWLMIVIAILAIPFVFYFNKTDLGAQGANQFVRLYNRSVSMTEAQRHARLYDLAQALGMSRFCQDLTGGMGPDPNNANQVRAVFAINLIILRHEAERLGLHATSEEIAEFVRNVRLFRGPSGFDQKKYDEFTQNALTPYGMGEPQIEEVVGDHLALNRLKDLVAVGINVPESEAKTEYERAYGKLFANVIRVQSGEFAKDIKITDDDIQKYYESHKAALKTEEKRKVEFVSLPLTEEQKKLQGKERIDALQKLADHANDFSQALLEKGADFRKLAAKFQLPVETTGEFTAAAPDPKLKDPQLAATAFQLTVEEPNSDVLQQPDGFYVLHLAGVDPARPLTLEEAKPKIVDAIKTSRAREMVATKGAKLVHDLREGLKAGEPLATILQKANVKSEKIEPFTLVDDFGATDDATKKKDRPSDFPAIKSAVASLRPGEVSDLVPWQEGGLVVYLEKQEPPDQSKYQQAKVDFEKRILNNKREIVFAEWLRERQNEAGLRAERAEPGQRPPAQKRKTG